MIKEYIYTVFIALIALLVHVYWEDLEKLLAKNNKGEPIELISTFGPLQGQTGVTREGRKIYKFTSIPYAKPPVEKLRFEPPIDYGKWEGVLDATRKTPACIQFDFLWQKLDGQEDCLYLNVFTPKLNAERNNKKLLPVMVFIHGGHFMFGSSELFGPEYLLDEDVVLVTIHYRLNVLGFLNTGDHVSTGNQGLKDQVAALKWIKEAIKDFGGDPNLVTLFGCSAGGASVSYQMISKMSEGLFHRAISQSGTNQCSWAFTKFPKRQATRFGALAGCPTENSIDLVKCLKRKPAEELVSIHQEFMDVFHDADAAFSPSIEQIEEAGTIDTSKIFLSESPTKLMEDGKFHKIPWINGVTKDEGCFRAPLIVNDETKLNQLNNNWSSVLPQALVLRSDDPNTMEQIREFYFPQDDKFGKEIREIRRGDLQNITNLYSDRWFFGCSRDATIYHSKHAPVWVYHFNKKPDMGYGYILELTRMNMPPKLAVALGYFKFLFYRHILGIEDIDEYGVCHTDDLHQLFKLIPELEIPVNSKHFPFSRNVVKLWVSFAKNGKPDPFQGVEWTKVVSGDSNSNMRYLELGEDAKMILEPFTSRIKFWEALPLLKN